jgi:L-alanine-DL-glutamate epimerase-like enolase superfamily enzyme
LNPKTGGAGLKLEMETLTLKTKHPFRIARGETSKYRNFVFHLTLNGLEGLGEAAPQTYYGESEDTVMRAVRRIEKKLDGDPRDLRGRIDEGDLHEMLAGDASVRAALDMALWDLEGKSAGKPCFELLSLDPAKTPLTSYTIGFDSPEVVKAKLDDAARFPILKMKMGIPGDFELLDMVLAETGKKVRVDANEGWNLDTAKRAVKELEDRGIEFVEQPLSHHRREELKELKRMSGLPIILDESVVSPADVEGASEIGDGINIKLMKCGGMTPALAMIEKARAEGLKVMLGCMIETSVGITAAAHLSPLVDFADLDGNVLLAEDPFVGVGVEEGKLVLPRGAGLGVQRRGTSS